MSTRLIYRRDELLKGLLPTIRVKAVTATQAEAVAHLATGKKVLRVERVDD